MNRQLIIDDLKIEFTKENIKCLDEIFDVFIRILDEIKISEIKDALLLPAEQYTGLQLKTARTALISKFETFIKSVYNIVQIEIEGELKVCLVEFFNRFSFLNTNSFSYKFFDKDDTTKVPLFEPAFFKGKMPFGKELKTTYDLRNAILHKGKLYGNTEPSNETLHYDIKAVIISMLFITYKFFPQIKNHFDKKDLPDFSGYLSKVKENFNKWNNRFVHIRGKEEFEEIALFARETDWEIEDRNENVTPKERREGKIEDLRKRLISENQFQMIIAGDAGIGKSTTMQYLAYKDTNTQKHLPIYIELKLISPELSLEQTIIDKTGIEKEELKSIFNKGLVCLFLDGLNEILPNIKPRIFVEIHNLIINYPKIFILLSTRQQDYKNDFGKIPVFILQRMQLNQINEFLQKNAKEQFVRDKIINALNSNTNWQKILGTPLILFMLIQIVNREQDIPNDESKIILKFILNLCQREREKDITFDVDFFRLLLTHLAFESIEKKGNTNAGLTLFEVEEFLQKKDKNISIQTVRTFLKKATELNIMVQDNSLYSFIHQSYQETLAGDYFNTFFS